MESDGKQLDHAARERIHAHARQLAEQAPPLSSEQRDALRVLLATPARRSSAGLR